MDSRLRLEDEILAPAFYDEVTKEVTAPVDYVFAWLDRQEQICFQNQQEAIISLEKDVQRLQRRLDEARIKNYALKNEHDSMMPVFFMVLFFTALLVCVGTTLLTLFVTHL